MAEAKVHLTASIQVDIPMTLSIDQADLEVLKQASGVRDVANRSASFEMAVIDAVFDEVPPNRTLPADWSVVQEAIRDAVGDMNAIRIRRIDEG